MHGYLNTLYDLLPSTYLNLTYLFMLDLLLLFLNIFSLLFISFHLIDRSKMLNHDLSIFSCSFSRCCPGIICLCIGRFLGLSTGNLRMHPEARGCSRMLLKMVCQACGRNGIQIVGLFAL